MDVKSNSVTITAPPEKIALAKRIIEENDKPGPGQTKEVSYTEPEIRKYPVPAGTADAIGKTLQADMQGIRIIALPTSNELIVLATVEEHFAVMQKLKDLTGTGNATASDIVPLFITDPTEMAAKLVKLFPSPAQGGPTIEAQPGGMPGIIIRGTTAQIAEIRKTVELIEGIKPGTGGAGSPFGPNTRVIMFPDGAGSLLAEQMKRAMEDMKKNPVIIKDPLNPPKSVLPNPGTLPPAPAPSPAPGTTSPYPPNVITPKISGADLPGDREALPGRDLRYIGAQVVDPTKKPDKKPITIEVQGNRLIITSEDTDALDLLASMAQYYRPNAPAQENLFKVIRLKNVLAEDAAKELTEIFNGPQQQQQGGGGGRQGGGLLGGILGGGGGGGLLGGLLGGGGGGAAAPAGVNPNRVRVVAERSSNSVIVIKAAPLDLLIMEHLLGRYIDGGTAEDAVTMKTWIIKVNNADASEMATLVRDVYRSATASGTAGNAQQVALPFPFAQPQGQTNQKPPALAVSTDDRSNTLILMCTEPLMREIALLVATLDQQTTANTEVVKLVRLGDLDPSLVQQAVLAIQGINPQQQGRGGFGGGGMGGLGGGGFGGGGQGGFGGGGFPGLGGGGFGGGGFPGLGGGGFGEVARSLGEGLRREVGVDAAEVEEAAGGRQANASVLEGP